jgi:hypothetical protein
MGRSGYKISWTPPCFIEVFMPSQQSERSCIYIDFAYCFYDFPFSFWM